MRFEQIKTTLKTAVSAATVFLLGSGLALAQQQVNLTAGPTNIILPDGSNVPMWGYTCGAVVSNSLATCAAANPSAAGWSPVVITVPTGQSLTINLTNNLSFTPLGSTTPNTIPTSLMIVGQVGGGLGSGGTSTPSPAHPQQVTTWPNVGSGGAVWTPPAQGPRVQSFGTEVAFGQQTALTWTTPRAGTYLLESGTHPSIQATMGLIGTLVVTSAPTSSGGTETGAGTAYPNVKYDAEVPLVLSEIDPALNNAVNAAVNTAGFSEIASRGPTVGGAVAEVNVTNNGSYMATPPTVSFTGGGGTGATATAYINTPCTSAGVPDGCGTITIVVTSGGTNYTSAPTVMLTGGDGTGAAAQSYLTRGTNSIATCSTPSGTVPACYPPVVNYTPLYYMINGVPFSRANASSSLFPVTPTTLAPASGTGSVLVRFVNAGLHMHVPTIVGSQTMQNASGTPVATGGFELIAEDGNPLPGIPRVQSEVFMAAGKTYDVMINAPASGGMALPVYDRELSLSGNAINRDAGMLAYLSINGSSLPNAGSLAAATANPDTYNSVVPGFPLTISDASKGVIANDVNVLGVQVSTAPTQGTLTLNANGTFTYVPNARWTAPDTFGYCGNGATSGQACTTVTLNAAPIEAATGITLTCPAPSYTSKEATYIKVPPPGVLSCIKDALGYPVTVDVSTVIPTSGLSVNMDANGGFSASVSGPTMSTFTFQVKNAQGTEASNPTGSTPASKLVTATLTFPQGSGLSVSVVDGKTKAPVTDYRWIIEEDKTFYISPNCTSNPPPAGCIQTSSGTVPLLGTNFHTSDMTYVAQGCTGPQSCESGQMVVDPSSGQHIAAVCDVGNGKCRPDPGNGKTAVNPSQVVLDPSKRYYISVLPGDAADPFQTGNSGTSCALINGQQSCGHSMGGAPVPVACTPPIGSTTCTGTFPPVTVLVEQDPFPPADLAVNVFEDDFPLNGEQDSGGGIDVLATNEPGLGGFNILLWDDMGGSGDVTGQMTYDMFNQPLSNSLDGYIDPATGQNACPITQQGQGITGMIVTCPKFEADGVTLSPLAGEAVVKNLMPGRFSVQAIPAADRIAKGEEWLQTNTLDGQKAHDSFLRIGEPDYFQEFGPANYHVNIGFANPKIITSRLANVCNGNDPNAPNPGQKYACTSTVTGKVTTERMSRTPDERLYSSGSRDSFFFTQCYVSIGDPDGEDFAFAKCNADGTFSISGLPEGQWRLTTFDQWNDQLVDGLSFPIQLAVGATLPFGDVPANQWQANVYTRTFIDDNKDGVSQTSEGGIPFINTTVRYRDGSLSNNLVTDLTGTANFNEEFPLFNWYVVETDTTRYKTTGIHTVYDAGGPADGTASCGQKVPGYPLCGSTDSKSPYAFLANTAEQNPLPADLSVPGAVYCPTSDCASQSIANGPVPSGAGVSTGRIDPPWLGGTEGWQGFSGENNFIEFGKAPYVAGENGGIKGHVIYASTRPFDDPQMLVQTQWEPLVPHVKINLYQEGTAADGITPTLTLVDSTQTSSWDDFAQGFRLDANGNPIKDANGNYIPNMNCPGQSTTDPFYFSLENQPNYLDYYNNVEHSGGTGSATPLPYNAQFKCYDGLHNWNQLQPVPYDGMYSFPSVTTRDANGKPTGTNCLVSACTTDPASDEYGGIPMLKPGKYVVEVVPPEGYEIVKEEDKNILIGDDFIAPVTQQFGGLSDIFIIPDQAQVGSAYNPYNPQDPTQSLGAQPNNGIVPGFTPEPTWPCVGESRVVPDYISLFPQSKQVAPFAGATRNLCDRKEVTLSDQAGAIAKFYVYTSTHKAAKFTGVITDDFTSEFDPFSPQFGEKFAPPNMPIAIKDWTGTEIGRVYSDWWGDYDGLTYSTWEVNPPNPTGYSPTMMIFCMNDKGTGTTPDPLFNPGYSQFCYELPYMPGQTQYLDTPVVPTSAFSAGYNHPDCSYPAATPAIKEVDGKGPGTGPWVGTSIALSSLTLGANPGSGYTSTSVTFSGGGGSGAAATDTLKVVNFAIIAGGSYTTAPTVTIAPPPAGGTQATATARLAIGFGPRGIAGFTITNPGSGYTSVPSVTFSSGGAHANAVMGVGAITLSSSGTGYTSAPTVTIGGGGTGATATAVLSSMATSPLTITALGDQQVINNAYSGPTATAAPFNNQFVTRHYGFGGAQGTVTIGGAPATVTSWSDSSITVTVPALGGTNGVPLCAIQQQAQYFPTGVPFTPAYCGQLVITTASGLQSVDTVTVTIGGKAPTMVSGTTPLSPTGTGAIQQAIDNALPGDLIIVPPGDYQEMVMMWKPVRLQGVGAASSIIDANAQPAGKMDPWRKQLGCLFGLDPTGTPLNSFQSCASWTAFTPGSSPQVDRLPLEGIVGWDTTTNGNLAQLLSEPTLMGAYEGAAITVVGKGVLAGPGDYFGVANEAAFPTGSVVLTANNCGGLGAQGTTTNPYPSNFQCNPSSIDGLTLTDSSEGGGGLFVHAWAHNLQIANNRVYGNIGTLSGGINVGQGESPDAYLNNTDLDTDPASCETTLTNPATGFLWNPNDPTNTQEPYCFDLYVNVHNNSVTSNTSIGDELFSGTPAGAGGVSFCTGADYYKFNYNWVCGNMSTGDGGGVAHIGFNKNGDIEHNTIIFNQSLNPTIPTNGGGLIVMATAPDGTLPGAAAGTECGSVTDVDCAPGLGDGTGPGLVINANLIMGNAAEAGSGGGIRFQGVNGTDIPRFPNSPNYWYGVTATNNIITNNVAGWDGGGVSLQDALKVNLINNTIASNDSTATAGVLFNTLGAPLASAPGVSLGGQLNGLNSSAPQPAGVVTMANSTNLTAALPGSKSNDFGLTCPASHANCGLFSNPYLANDLIWQNRTFFIGVGTNVQPQFQQNLVTLYNSVFTGGVPSSSGGVLTNQTATGQCVAGSNYWDIGVRGDTGPGNHASGFTLAPTYSLLTNPAEIGTGTNNLNASPDLMSQYCNGSRVPPEFAKGSFNVPPGISDATVPNPIFNLSPAATVDEGNNWINMTWGPLAETNPTNGKTLGNYALTAGSPAINDIASTFFNTVEALVPQIGTDFYGHTRPYSTTLADIGAVEFQGTSTTLPYASPTALDFGAVGVGSTSTAQTLTLTNPTGATLTGIAVTVTAPYSRSGGTCGATLTAAAGNCTIILVFSPTSSTNQYPTGTATIAVTGTTVLGSPVALTGEAVPPTYLATVTPTSLTFGSQVDGTASTAQTLTVTNTGTAVLSVGTFTFSTGFAQAAGGTCTATLAVNASCTLNVAFAPTTAQSGQINGTLTIAYADTGTAATVTPSPVPLSGTAIPQILTATVTGGPLAFGNWAIGTTSGAKTLTVTNTGNTALAGGTFTVVGGAPFSRPTGAASGTCGAALGVGGTCTINVVFAPTALATYSRTLTVAYGTATVTGSPVTLTGAGVATRATVSIAPNPLTITLASGTLSGSGTVTLTNTAAAGGSSVSVTNVSVTGSGFVWAFTAGTNACTGASLQPGASCTVQVNFSRLGSVGTHTGSITFTDTATGSPQSGVLTGVAH